MQDNRLSLGGRAGVVVASKTRARVWRTWESNRGRNPFALQLRMKVHIKRYTARCSAIDFGQYANNEYG